MSHRVFERERERDHSFNTYIYIFSGVVFGQFLIAPTSRNGFPRSLICWIKLGQPDLGTHPTPTIITWKYPPKRGKKRL